MFLNKTLDMPNFVGTEAPARLKTYRIQPEFGNPVFSFDMHMRWLSTIASVEEEPIWTYSLDSGHCANAEHGI